MQPHTPNRKRRALAIRFFTYGVMTLATAAISIVCILLVMGYRFDFTKHSVSQGALIQLMSFPSGANVTFDNQILSFLTPGKRNVDIGQHTVAYNLDGYREWSKTVNVKAGELRWLNYARLIPQSITTSSVHEFPAVTSNLPSPDRKWMAIYGAADKPELTIADLRDGKSIKLQNITIPAAAFTAPAPGQTSAFNIVEWDFSGKFLLIRHVVGDKTEFISLDRTKPEDAKDISAKFNIPLSDVHYSGSSGNVFYGLQGTDVRKLDLGAGTISEPIASNVTNFTLYKTTTLGYVTNKDDRFSVGVSIDGQSGEVRSYDSTTPVLMDVSSYFSDYYVAVARGTQVDIVKNPVGDGADARKTIASFQVPVGVKWLQFSNSGRFVVAGSGGQFVTYDMETKEQFTTNLPGVAPDLTRPLQWLDDYYLVSTYDKNLRLSEFDGGNQNVITDVEPGSTVTVTDDGKYMLSIARTTNGYALQSSKMTIEK